MFETYAFKKDALAKLKGRWMTPCIATVVMIILFALTGSYYVKKDSFVALLLAIFILGAAILAYTGLFIKLFNTMEPLELSDFVNGFSTFLKGFLAFLWAVLWVILWSCLFIIPGFVKAFSYSMIFHILAENPSISVFKALNLSKVLTRGYKGDLFMLALSFLGWEILGMLSCGILEIWIRPYESMTFTNAYYFLKSQALRTGTLTPADFQ